MNCQTVFHSICCHCAVLLECIRVPISLYPQKHLLFSMAVCIIAILICVKWYCTVVLICFPQWLRTWRTFHELIDHQNIIFGDVYSSFLPVLKSAVCFTLLLSYRALYILDINHLPGMWFTNTSTHSVDCFFTGECPPRDKSFKFWWSPIYLFFLLLPVLLLSHLRHHYWCNEDFPIFF